MARIKIFNPNSGVQNKSDPLNKLDLTKDPRPKSGLNSKLYTQGFNCNLLFWQRVNLLENRVDSIEKELHHHANQSVVRHRLNKILIYSDIYIYIISNFIHRKYLTMTSMI